MAVVLVTGSAGLIGSETVQHFCDLGFDVVGIDNDMRKRFFGDEASTAWNRSLLESRFPRQYRHFDADIRGLSPGKQALSAENEELRREIRVLERKLASLTRRRSTAGALK